MRLFAGFFAYFVSVLAVTGFLAAGLTWLFSPDQGLGSPHAYAAQVHGIIGRREAQAALDKGPTRASLTPVYPATPAKELIGTQPTRAKIKNLRRRRTAYNARRLKPPMALVPQQQDQQTAYSYNEPGQISDPLAFLFSRR